MSPAHLRAGYFALTAANMLATSYYLNYLFFYFRDRFGYGDRENLWVSALYGLIYTVAAWQGGRFAERRGYQTSIRLGFGALGLCMIASGAVADRAVALLALLVVYSLVLLLTWPALEAAATAGASRRELPHLVGLYNCTWSSASAVAYFTGGTLYELSPRLAVFWIPAAMFLTQWLAAVWLSRQSVARDDKSPVGEGSPGQHPEPAALAQSVPPATFLSLAWFANPFCYVGIFTLLPIMPGLAQRLGLSPAEAGVVCSVWFFARLAAFLGLWRWTGWHYRFRWMVAAGLLQLVGFAGVLVAPTVGVLVVAQVAFGLAIGLVYYASLFYAMDVGDTKAEHGGLHEAAIGAGSAVGPALGAAALHLFPGQLYAGATAVSGLLAASLGGMVWIWARARSR